MIYVEKKEYIRFVKTNNRKIGKKKERKRENKKYLKKEKNESDKEINLFL